MYAIKAAMAAHNSHPHHGRADGLIRKSDCSTANTAIIGQFPASFLTNALGRPGCDLFPSGRTQSGSPSWPPFGPPSFPRATAAGFFSRASIWSNTFLASKIGSVLERLAWPIFDLIE